MRRVIVTDPPYGALALKWDQAAPAIAHLRQLAATCSAAAICCNHKLLADLLAARFPLPFHDLVVWNKTPTRTWSSWSKPLRSVEFVGFWGAPQEFDFRKSLDPRPSYKPSRRPPNMHFRAVPRLQNRPSFAMWEQVWNIPAVRRKQHPTQKPPELIRRLVNIFALRGPVTVLDPFEGSGTTGKVCAELGIPYEGHDTGAWKNP